MRDEVYIFIYRLFACSHSQQSGAAEACWAHNPEVARSKLASAIIFFLRRGYVSLVQILASSTTSMFKTD